MIRDIHKELADALRALDEIHREGPTAKSVYRATPGCTRGCPRCDIKCAVVTGIAYDLQQEVDGLAPSLQWGGHTYGEMFGMA